MSRANSVMVRFKAQGISAVNHYLVYGAPSPFTYWGFTHNLTLKLGIKLKDEKILPVIHSFKNRISNGCFVQIKSNQRMGGNSKVGTIVDNPRADIDCSIVFQYEVNDVEIDEDIIKKQIMKLRFSGGVILVDSIKVKVTKDENKIGNFVDKGYIFDEIDIEEEGENIIEDIFNQTKPMKKNGWSMPTLLGYSLLEEPQMRDNVRFGYKHAFAEPYIGVIEYRMFEKFGDEPTTLFEDGWRIETEDKKIKITKG